MSIFVLALLVTLTVWPVTLSSTAQNDCTHFDIKKHHPDDPTILISRESPLPTTFFSRNEEKELEFHSMTVSKLQSLLKSLAHAIPK